MACSHKPPCPPRFLEDGTTLNPARYNARMVADHRAEQGWALLCNGEIKYAGVESELLAVP
jgi:Family of unknown function (DUF5999)